MESVKSNIIPWESARDRTLATLDEQSHRQVGPKNLFDRPAREPHSSSIKFPRGGWHAVETRAEPKCDERGGVAEFFNRRGRAGADGEGAAEGENCGGVPAVGVRVRSGVQRTREMRKRCSGGADGNRYTVQSLLPLRARGQTESPECRLPKRESFRPI